jgi:hypothetical protein
MTDGPEVLLCETPEMKNALLFCYQAVSNRIGLLLDEVLVEGGSTNGG